jgi:hypothetical protein
MSQVQKTPTKFIIRGVGELPANSPSRTGKMDTLVTYTAGPNTSFTIRIPSENASKENIQKTIRDDYTKRGNLIGHEFSL